LRTSPRWRKSSRVPTDITDARPDFSTYVATLGRGPGRSRPLTRAEARDAFARVLAGEVDPHQLGAFLMLLRYRGEDAGEVAGIVEAMQATLPAAPSVDLDWPSYGAGRTRALPWFLLAALALGRAGTRVLMHGSNEFGSATSVAAALAALGRSVARDMDEAEAQLDADGFAYLPIATLSPGIAGLLGLRKLFGLRSPVNTAVRLLDPARAPSGVDGVFHPAYLDVHLGVAELLGRPRLLVLKGGGGEAERVPAKPGAALLWDAARGRSDIALPADPAFDPAPLPASPVEFARIWRGEAHCVPAEAIIGATIALCLLARGTTADPAAARREASKIWEARLQN
jgi:anthranilate phosphoribosyltransferase